jgi:hypothetical protein
MDLIWKAQINSDDRMIFEERKNKLAVKRSFASESNMPINARLNFLLSIVTVVIFQYETTQLNIYLYQPLNIDA